MAVERIKLSNHFYLDEFACRCKQRGHDLHDGFCGGAVLIDPSLLGALGEIRFRFGPTTIVSGFRCWRYHEEIYKERKKEPTRNSSHLTGHGADLWTKEKILYPDHQEFLQSVGITGIGHKEGRITHVDTGHETLTVWRY